MTVKSLINRQVVFTALGAFATLTLVNCNSNTVRPTQNQEAAQVLAAKKAQAAMSVAVNSGLAGVWTCNASLSKDPCTKDGAAGEVTNHEVVTISNDLKSIIKTVEINKTESNIESDCTIQANAALNILDGTVSAGFTGTIVSNTNPIAAGDSADDNICTDALAAMPKAKTTSSTFSVTLPSDSGINDEMILIVTHSDGTITNRTYNKQLTAPTDAELTATAAALAKAMGSNGLPQLPAPTEPNVVMASPSPSLSK